MFDEEGYRGGTKATLLEFAESLKRPAAFRDLRAHGDPWGMTFGKADIEALTAAAVPASKGGSNRAAKARRTSRR